MAKFQLEPLSRVNFDTWKLQMIAMLIKTEGWQYISGKTPKPQVLKVDSKNVSNIDIWIEADQKAQADIILSISPSELKQVKNC